MGFARVHSRLLVWTNGRPSHLTPRLRCLVLETRGRRTGRLRRTVLLFMPDGDDFVVLASNFGQDRPPAWWLNLQATSHAAVVVAGRRIAVHVRELEGEERAAVLQRAVHHNKQWREYATTLVRPLPVLCLVPDAPQWPLTEKCW